MENILVVKQKGNLLKLKIAKRKKNQYSSPEYRKNLNPQEPNDLALFLADLRINFNSPINEAFKIMRKDEAEYTENGFWFWGSKD